MFEIDPIMFHQTNRVLANHVEAVVQHLTGLVRHST